MTDFVIIYDRRTGHSVVKSFADSSLALLERLKGESEISDPEIEVAQISAPSLESLRRTHSRYFMGTFQLSAA